VEKRAGNPFALFFLWGAKMTKRMIVPLVFGVVGVAILLLLGFWQLRRMEWKQTLLNNIAARIAAPAVDIPIQPNKDRDSYLHVRLTGTLSGEEIHVLASQKYAGPGFEIISKLQTSDGPVLVDLGFVPEKDKNTPRPTGEFTITGNLLWPDAKGYFTPQPDLTKNEWFARDLPAMAARLKTSKVLVVASAVEPAVQGLPKPVQLASNIPNRHFEYVLTWFSLAIVWFGMTLYLLWRIRQKTV